MLLPSLVLLSHPTTHWHTCRAETQGSSVMLSFQASQQFQPGSGACFRTPSGAPKPMPGSPPHSSHGWWVPWKLRRLRSRESDRRARSTSNGAGQLPGRCNDLLQSPCSHVTFDHDSIRCLGECHCMNIAGVGHGDLEARDCPRLPAFNCTDRTTSSADGQIIPSSTSFRSIIAPLRVPTLGTHVTA